MGRISVVIPAHNAEAFLSEALDSVFDQGLEDPEVVVVDDGSTDGTGDLVRRYGRGVRVLRVERAGSARARNVGLAETTGEIVAFLDADDVWLGDKTNRQLPVLEGNPALGLVFSDMISFDEEGTGSETYFQQRGFDGDCSLASIFLYDMISTPTVLMRREVLGRVGDFDEGLKIGQDTDLWFRIAREFPFEVVDRPLVRRRFHRGNTTRDARLLARCVVEIWGRHLDACILSQPQRERELRQDFSRKRWNHHFLEGCSLLHEGRSKEARMQFGRAIGEVPFSPRAYAFLLASYFPVRAAGDQSQGGHA